MLQTVLIVIGALIAAVLAIAAMKPSTFRVVRAARITAPADKIFPHLSDFHQWAAWSPWEKLDPTMKKTYSGVAGTPGSSYAWIGNKKTGTGSMTVTSVSTPTSLVIDLRFEKPWKAQNVTTFTLQPDGGATNVSWAMTGSSPFMMKVMGLFMNMDQLVGKDFESGLAALKGIVET